MTSLIPSLPPLSLTKIRTTRLAVRLEPSQPYATATDDLAGHSHLGLPIISDLNPA